MTNDDAPDPAPDDDAVYRAHSSELIAYAAVLVGRDDARDVVTDAVLSAFASREWPSVRNRRAYLYRAVLNRATSHHRSVARRQRRERRAAMRVVRSDDQLTGSIDAERALTRLSAQQRAVVYLAYWQDQTPAQIADLLDVTEGTVRKQLARARQQLRRILDA
ncbi:MAG: RNA polymerase sigma factor [Actinomycetota bacterium]|nr:RNA polymerase sigma factor [Actinomycetota bacterium]